MAMGLLAHHLEQRGMDARVHSAGTIGWGGPATDHAVEILAERGIDLSDHESRRLTPAIVADADLVLGMTRDHVTGSLNHHRDAADRTFVMGEVVRLGRKVGPRRAGQSVREWSAEVAALRLPNRPPGIGGDEIADPVGEGMAVYQRTAEQLDRLCVELVALLIPDRWDPIP